MVEPLPVLPWLCAEVAAAAVLFDTLLDIVQSAAACVPTATFVERVHAVAAWSPTPTFVFNVCAWDPALFAIQLLAVVYLPSQLDTWPSEEL